MFRNLNASSLGIEGRQSELIELALTFRFQSMDIDVAELVRRVERQSSVEQAVRFLKGAPVAIGGFEIPTQWTGDEASYKASLEQLKTAATIAATVEAKRCLVTIDPASDTLPYHENFEMHRQRLSEMAGLLDEQGVQLGLDLCASPTRRDKQFQFTQQFDELLTLLKSTSGSNIGLVLDSWDWRLGGGSLEQIAELADRILLVRVADISPEADLTTIDDSQRVLPAADGVVDNAAILKQLAESKYDGPVELNVSPSCFDGMPRDKTVQKASEVLEALLNPPDPAEDDSPAPPVAADA